MNPAVPQRLTFARGFTLTEMAIVLLIVALLIGGLLVPMSAQMDIRNQADTQKKLAEIQEALLGYAVARGRLPCPAVDAATGEESPLNTGNCTTQEGFLPATTLGLSPTDANGYALDAWNNRIRYAITDQNGKAFTTPNGMRNAGLSNLAPDLRVCPSAAACGSPLTTNAVAVIYSVGANGVAGGAGGASADEMENPNPNSGANPDPTAKQFVSRGHTPTYDDIVIWLSPNVLYNRLIAAGQLP